MKRLLLAFCLSYSASLAFAQGAGAPPPVPEEAARPPEKFIANGGDTVEIPGAGFSIVPPAGWEVIRNGSGASLLFQAPKPPQPPGVVTYQPNIRVMMLDGPRPMDNETKEEYGKIIVEKNSVVSSSISNYLLRSAEKVQLQSGIDAFLYYAEFSFSGTPTMQMHVLVSSGTKHFLMTYTDLANVFENQEPGLTTAYTSMQSVKLDSAPPARWIRYQIVGGCILAFFVFLMLVRFIRVRRMRRLGERIENEDGGESTIDYDHDSYDARSSVSAISEIADYDDSDDMPETHEAPVARKAEKPAVPAPAPVAKKAAPAQASRSSTPAPAPAPVAKQKPSAPAVPKPAARAPVDKFESRTRKTPLNSKAAPSAPQSEVSSYEPPVSGTWNVDASAWHHHDDSEEGHSDVSEVRNSVAPAMKSKHQKASSPRAQEPDFEEDISKVARLSEILPNTGDTKKKKKGFFSWGKGKDKGDEALGNQADDGFEVDGDDDWDKASKSKPKDKGYKVRAPAPPISQAKSSSSALSQPVSQVSEIADWNLDQGHADHDSDDEDD